MTIMLVIYYYYIIIIIYYYYMIENVKLNLQCSEAVGWYIRPVNVLPNVYFRGPA